MKNLCKRERMNKLSKRERKNEKKGKRKEKLLFQEQKYFERHQNKKREGNNRKVSAENRQKKTWLKIIELDLLIYFFISFLSFFQYAIIKINRIHLYSPSSTFSVSS